jgi:hypothetical protein
LRASANSSRTRCAPTPDDHLDELRRAGGEERHARLPGRRAGEQRLPGAGRAAQQHPLRGAGAQAPVLARVLQKVDDIADLGLDLVDPGDVVEVDPHRLRVDRLALGPATEQAAAHHLPLAAEQPPVERDQQQQWGERDQQVRQ